MTQPLVPSDVDLRGYEFMPLYGHHLFGSDFNAGASDSGWRAAVTLWWAAWNQVPAASLPNDDVALTRLADLGRDVKSFRKIRAEALHGFELCDDGRLYHKQLAKWAIEAWDRRVKERQRKANWRSKHAGQSGDVPGTRTGQQTGQDDGRRRDVPAEGKREDRTGQDRELKKTKPSAPAALPGWVPPDLWSRFCEMRKAKKKPLTEFAETLAIKELERLRDEGNDPAAVLEQSIFRTWDGLFPVNERGVHQASSGKGATLSPAGQQTAANLAAWIRQEEANDAARP